MQQRKPSIPHAGEDKKYLLYLLDPLVSNIRFIGASETGQACFAKFYELHVLYSVPIAKPVTIFVRHLLDHESGSTSLLPNYPCHSYEGLHHILVHCRFVSSTSMASHLVLAH